MKGRNKPGTAGARYLAAALAAALILASVPADAAAPARGRGGAMVVVALKKGGDQAGELVTVRPDALALLDPSGLDLTIDPAEVRSVRVVRSSKGGVGGMIGLVIGAAGGYLGGLASGGCPSCEVPLASYGLGVLGGLVGLGAGAVIGGAAGRDVVVSLDVETGPERMSQLRKLRRYARVASPL